MSERRARLQIFAFIFGFGLGTGTGLLVRWLTNSVLAPWLTARFGLPAPHSGWFDVLCLGLIFAFGMMGAVTTLGGIYWD